MIRREPLYRCAPDCRTSFGDLAAKVGAGLGLPPDDEQQSSLDAIFAERAPGEPAARHAAVIGARQNIKTSTLIIAAATDLLVLGVPGAIWTAHESKTASKAYEDLLPRLLGNEDYASLIDYRGGRGEERIFLADDPAVSLEYRARSGGSGRGFTTSRITLDEALYLRAADMGALLPTMLTRTDAQVRYGSSGGFASSEVLRSLRARAKAGNDPRLFYVEYGAEHRDCADEACSHIFGQVEGCALDDRELWWQANSALWCGRITEENVLDLRRSMPPGEFAREVLVWWDEPGSDVSSIDPLAWESRTDQAGEIRAAGIAFDVSLDRSRTSIGVTGPRHDGKQQVELVEYGRGTGWVVERCAELFRDWSVPVTVAGGGPGGSLIPDLEAAGVAVNVLNSAETAQACGAFADAVNDGTLVHLGDPTLTAAVLGARLKGGESFVFTRKGDVDISPLYAVTLAHWQATTVPEITEAVW